MKISLKRITLDTNPEDCNLNCIMCEEHSKYSTFKENLFNRTGFRYRRMSPEIIEKVFYEANLYGVKEIIPSTMGEPLLYKHINLFFELASKYNIKINLTTNGTFPGLGAKKWAEKIIPVTSDTKISFNGATKSTAENIMRGLNFEKQLSNIKEFVKYRNQYFNETGYTSNITLQLTFMKNNMPELIDIIYLASLMDIDRIKGHHLWIHFKEIENQSIKSSESLINKWNDIVIKAKEASEKFRKPNGEKIILENIELINFQKNTIINSEYNCPFLNNELWISATGKISPCCAPDEKRNSLGDFRTYPQTGMLQVLESKVYKNLVNNYKSYELCKTCVMRKK